MDNLPALRFLMVAVMLIATTAGTLAFAFMKFPDNAVVIFFSVALIVVVVFFVQKKENAARFEAYYSTVQELGTPVSFNKYSASFERNGTRFDVDYPQGKNSMFFKVNFYVPKIKEKFPFKTNRWRQSIIPIVTGLQKVRPCRRNICCKRAIPLFCSIFSKIRK